MKIVLSVTSELNQDIVWKDLIIPWWANRGDGHSGRNRDGDGGRGWGKGLYEYTQRCRHVSSAQSLSRVRLRAAPWTASCQASLSITNSQGPPKPMSIESVMPSNHLMLSRPFSSCPQSFPASESFQMSQFFTSGGQSIGVSASASVLPMNIQDQFPLGWTGWISLQSNGLWRVFSNTTIQKHQFFGAQSSLWSKFYIHIHDY